MENLIDEKRKEIKMDEKIMKVEAILKDNIENSNYIVSDTRLYRLAFNKLDKGLITVMGGPKTNKTLMAIHIAQNARGMSNIIELFMTRTHSVEEFTNRIATAKNGVAPVISCNMEGPNVFSGGRGLDFESKVYVCDCNENPTELITNFVHSTNTKFKMIIIDDCDPSDLSFLRSLADKLGCIIVTTVSTENGHYYYNPSQVIDLVDANSDCVIRMSHYYIDGQIKIQATYQKNKTNDLDTIYLDINHKKQSIKEHYEEVVYYGDDEFPF